MTVCVPTEAFTRAKPYFTVLLTSPDSNVILVKALREAAKSAQISVKIIACDQGPRKSPASLLADAAYELPSREHAGYVDAIIEVCVAHRVDLVIPFGSLDVTLLDSSRSRFGAIGVALAVSSTPLIHAARAWCSDALSRRQQNWRDVSREMRIPAARSFKVILYFDRAGELQTIIPCERMIDRGVEHLITRRDPRVIAPVKSKLRSIGSTQSIITLHAVLDAHDQLFVDDVHHNLADTIDIAHQAGAHLIRWLLQEHAGLSVQPNDNWQEGVEMLRYSSALYLLPSENVSQSRRLLG